ncbi:MAG: hypothetical protein ACOC29_03690, partial [Candidatus Sumerlaeota bacterium]
MKKHAAALILLATFILLSACSHHAMKSTPVAFREHSTAEGPVEDRVNLWPLFYQRDPAWSALWPLIAASDEGSAVLPFYEYDRNDKDLRVGTVTQLAPPLMRFDEKDDNWRIFNIAKDNKHHEFRVMPLYFQDSDEPWYLLVPVFYWNRDDKVFWTPPYLKYPDGGALFFPLLHWKKDQREKQIDLFWPLVGARSQDYKFSKDRGVKALPFFYAEKDPQNNRSTLNILGLGLHAETTTDTLEMQYLIPLGSYEKRGGDDPMSRSRLVPFYLAESSEDKRMFFSLPYSHYQSGDSYFRNILLNAWISVGEGDESYLSLAFPVFHRFADGDDRGHMVAPFYMYYRKDNGDWRFHSALFNYKSDGTL